VFFLMLSRFSMDKLLDPMSWPLWVVVAGMILAAVIDGWKRRVPNWLTFSLILSGWALGLYHNLLGWELLDWRIDGWQGADGNFVTGTGGFLASLGCTMIGFLLLFPLLLLRGMGKGDVKMQMGFGAWVGAFFGWTPGWLIVILAFCVGAIIGGIIGFGMMIYNRSYRQNLQNMQAIMMDVMVGAGLGKMAERGQQLRDRGPKLPYGIPLCLGFVSYLAYWVYNQQ
jgi:prepilin peptidase CpaA